MLKNWKSTVYKRLCNDLGEDQFVSSISSFAASEQFKVACKDRCCGGGCARQGPSLMPKQLWPSTRCLHRASFRQIERTNGSRMESGISVAMRPRCGLQVLMLRWGVVFAAVLGLQVLDL